MTLTERNGLAVEHFDLIRRIAVSMGQRVFGPGAEVDDLMHHGNLALVKALDAYDPARGPLLPYLQQQVRYIILDLIRKENQTRRQQVELVPLEDALLYDHCRDHERLIDLRTDVRIAVSKLPPAQRRSITARYLGDVEAGSSYGASMSACFYAKPRLQRELAVYA